MVNRFLFRGPALLLALLLTSAQLAAGLTPAGSGLGKNKPEGFEIIPPWTEGREYSVTRSYGVGAHLNSGSKDRYALDFSLAAGDPIYPASPGWVEYAGTASGGFKCYGNFVFIRHENNLQTLYAHMSSNLQVVTGQVVDTSTLLGFASNSGGEGGECSFNAHLHFALYRGAAVVTTPSVGPNGGEAIVPEPFAQCTRNNRPECTDLNTTGALLRKERSAPAAVKDNFGRLYIFVRNNDGVLRYRFQTDFTNNVWSSWATLGDPALRFTNVPAAALDVNGRLWVFARASDGTLRFNVQTSPANNQWHGWRSFGGYIVGSPAVALNLTDSRAEGVGRLEIFVRGADNGLYRGWQVSNDGWSVWQGLQGTLTGNPAAATDISGRPRVFVRGVDYFLYNKQPSATGEWGASPWSLFQTAKSIGGIAAVRADDSTAEVITRGDTDSTPGTPEAFANFSDNDFLRVSPTGPNNQVNLGFLGSAPAAALNADGRLQVFGRTVDLTLRSAIQLGPHVWADGAVLTSLGVSTTIQSDLAVARAGDHRLHVFAWEGDTVADFLQGAINNVGSWSRASLDIP